MRDINFQSFIDTDTNPFLVFDHKGKIIYLNNSAEILFGYVTKQELYELTLQYAPQNFGDKHTNITLNYDSFTFHAVSVGYECEEYIYLRLYNAPRIKQNIKIDKEKLAITDINLLLEANITLFKSKYTTSLKLLTDPDIPAFKMDQNRFSKLLRKTFDLFGKSQKISIMLKFVVGEHIIIDNKRYHIIRLSIDASNEIENNSGVSTLAKECFVSATIQQKGIILEIPLLID